MICNNSLTIYHKSNDEETMLEKWTRFNYQYVWFFGGKGASLNKGYEQANDVSVRIPYDKNDNLDINDFSIGDIIVAGTLTDDIETQQDLKDYDVFNITTLYNNNFGNNQHIRLGGK